MIVKDHLLEVLSDQKRLYLQSLICNVRESPSEPECPLNKQGNPNAPHFKKEEAVVFYHKKTLCWQQCLAVYVILEVIADPMAQLKTGEPFWKASCACQMDMNADAENIRNIACLSL